MKVHEYMLQGLLGLALFMVLPGCQVPGPGPLVEEPPAAVEAPPASAPRVPLPEGIVQTPLKAFEEGRVSDVPARFRLASYNIQDFTDGVDDGFDRTEVMVQRQAAAAARMLDEVDPDMVVFQEIENGNSLSILNGKLKKPFPLAYITEFERRGRKDRLNVGLMTRLPVSDLVEIDLGEVQHPANLSRGAINFQVDLGEGRRLLVYGVHLKSNYGEAADNIVKRSEALKIIRAHAEVVMAQLPDVTWEAIILGDTNVDPELDQFKEDPSFAAIADWVDLFRGYPIEQRTTIPRRVGDPAMEFASACFDRIFVMPELKSVPWTVGPPQVLQKGVATDNVYVNPGENDSHVSDHYPVFVDISRD